MHLKKRIHIVRPVTDFHRGYVIAEVSFNIQKENP